ncbi:MAG: class D beta-lactamase [Bradyrhizobium sp.]|uniref:class D beta-lactamase n=1 Tax=Bradyrhizobium sp. TaxID=376 RepID=UPI001D729EE8|nr:class D beta-lactamase [Bradyrhizobium sp.]MBV9563055.1 class D beta-lactamase [Bradyrhizobium sp.]
MRLVGPIAPLTRRAALRLSIGSIALIACGRSLTAGSTERNDLEAVFKEHGVAGTFVLYDVAGDSLTLVNPVRAQTRLVPASTFKIANTIIALETGIVKDENEIIPYGGKPQPFKQWEKDMSMREAIALSAIPIYQEIARRVGLARYHDWLARLDYGNRQTGESVDTFWLDGPLETSAVEQVRFVARLAQQKLDASSRAQSITRDIIRLESKDGKTLYGKTGWRFSSTPNLGWWTGWVEHDGKIFAFSLNIDMPGAATDVPKRVAIGKAMLSKLAVL